MAIRKRKGDLTIMKKKLVLAFLLAGTLSMSSVAYASEGGQTLGEVTKETVEAPGR